VNGVVDGVSFWQHSIQQQDGIKSDGLKRRFHLSECHRRNSREQMEFDGERDDIRARELGTDIQCSISSGSASETESFQANSDGITAAEIRDRFSLQQSTFDISLNRRT